MKSCSHVLIFLSLLYHGVVETYMIEETDSGGDVDDLLGRRTWLAIQIDVHFDLSFFCFAREGRGAIDINHRG